jgi:UDP-N-acetyl-D-glucosamine dehydrogenase
VELTPERLAGFDAVVVTTDHAKFDYDMIKKNAKLIIDSRGVYREPEAHIVKA